MNSHRDNVKDAINKAILELGTGQCQEEADVLLTDAVFEALGITEDEQDMVNGYFMHHAGRRMPMSPEKVEIIIGYSLADDAKAKLVRNLFMKMFRAANGELAEAFSADDCHEIFISILKGSSDVTYKTLMELISNYNGGHEDFVLFPLTNEIRHAACPEEAMFYICKQILDVVIPPAETKKDDT